MKAIILAVNIASIIISTSSLVLAFTNKSEITNNAQNKLTSGVPSGDIFCYKEDKQISYKARYLGLFNIRHLQKFPNRSYA